jgi:hypothetical protein
LRETLTPQVLQLRAVQRWDGKLPVVSGDNAAAAIIDSAASASAVR